MGYFRTSLIAALIVCSWATFARTAEPPCADKLDSHARPEALRLAKVGEKALAEKRFGEALAAYERAYCLYPLPGLRKGASWAEVELGRCEPALRDAQFWTEHEQKQSRRKAAQDWLAEVQTRCGQLTVRSSPSGATLHLDGAPEPLGVTPWTGWVRAGQHDLAAMKDLFRTESQRIEVQGGADAHNAVLITLPAVSPPRPPDVAPVLRASSSPAPPSEMATPSKAPEVVNPKATGLSTGRKVAIAVLAMGVAALSAATAMSVKYGRDKARLEQSGLGSSVSGGVAQVNSDALAADIAWGVGGALAAVGTGLVFRF